MLENMSKKSVVQEHSECKYKEFCKDYIPLDKQKLKAYSKDQINEIQHLEKEYERYVNSAYRHWWMSNIWSLEQIEELSNQLLNYNDVFSAHVKQLSEDIKDLRKYRK